MIAPTGPGSLPDHGPGPTGSLPDHGPDPTGSSAGATPGSDTSLPRPIGDPGTAGSDPSPLRFTRTPKPTPVPDPFEDAQSLEDLEHEITTLAADIHAATHRMLVLIAEFHRRRGYELGGHRSTAHWLHFRTGIDMGAAREKVRAALALQDLPQTSEAMARGELSFSKVRAMTRVATPETEGELLAVARESTTAELEKSIRAWRHLTRDEEASLERRNYRRRRLSVFPSESGMYVVRGVVTPEVGALLMRAVEAAADALFCQEAKDETTPEQRRADALGLLAERAMAAGFGGEGSANPGDTAGGEGLTREGEANWTGKIPVAEEAREGSGNVSAEPRSARRRQTRSAPRRQTRGCPDGNPAPLSGTQAERYQVVLHLDPGTLSPQGQPGRSNLEDGTRVSAETSRRLCCDSALVKVLRGPDGEVLDVGRRTRTIPPAIRRALEIRDGGCRWPGCGLRFTAAHHVEHWAEGGKTQLANLLLLCAYHHRKVHQGGWKVLYNAKDDTALFFGPKGVLRYTRRGMEALNAGAGGKGPGPGASDRPDSDRPEALGADVSDAPGFADRLIETNRSAGITPDGWTPTARFHAWGLDSWDLEIRALDALDGEGAEGKGLERDGGRGPGDGATT